MDGKVFSRSASKKMGIFLAEKVKKTKRDTPERMSNEVLYEQGASAPRHPRQRDVRRTSKQRGRPVRPKGVAGMPLTGAV